MNSNKRMNDEEAKIIAECNEQFQPQPYRQVFADLGEWNFDRRYIEDFYETAKHLLEGIVAGRLLDSMHSVSATFLCRHYLEIAIKYTLFHSRWLKNERENAPADEVTDVAKTHDLQLLWSTLMRELKSRVPSFLATGLDLKFVEKFVTEFHSVDSSGERFRYPTEKITIRLANYRIPSALTTYFGSLLFDLKRAHDILETLDTYLVNQYGENEEWQSILNSY